ncbi:MAG: ribosomal RNA small subunit methyltransferase A [Deltaproteobacteria bacterium]|nr:ribosomal RNA small subunit methyltransferase A [Deltaproteobacteria bacterium]
MSNDDPRQILRAFGLRPRRRFGQNFLVNKGILDKIVDLLDPSSHDVVIEVGPGLGHLTERLAARSGRVLGIDADEDMVRVCRRRLATHENAEVLLGDAVTADYPRLLAAFGDAAVRVAGNLPFYCASELALVLLENVPFHRMVLMFQQEVARRILASPGGKEYGALSVACQLRARCLPGFRVRAGSFYPKPEVDAAVVRFEPSREALDPDCLLRVEGVTKALFSYRRKTLAKGLALSGLADRLAHDPLVADLLSGRMRPETLTPLDFYRLACAVRNAEEPKP